MDLLSCIWDLGFGMSFLEVFMDLLSCRDARDEAWEGTWEFLPSLEFLKSEEFQPSRIPGWGWKNPDVP